MSPRDYASLVLAVLLVCLGRCLVTPRTWSAFGLLAAGALWLPVNNGTAEGPVLYSVGASHGLTFADLIGIVAVTVAAYTLRRLARTGELRGPWRSTLFVGLVALAALAVGFGLAAATSG